MRGVARSFSQLKVVLHLVIVTSFLSSYSYGKTEFKVLPTSPLYVGEGGTAELQWTYSFQVKDNEFKTYSPVWFYEDNQGNRKIIGHDSGQMGWNFQIANSSCPPRLLSPTVRVSRKEQATLVIKDVITQDSGVYGCQLVLNFKVITRTAQLIVTATPTFTVRPNATTSVVENTDLHITCTAVGPPTPNVTWVNVSSSNTPIAAPTKGSAVLSINNIQRHQNGIKFKCTASNNPNQRPVETKVTTILVYYPPEFTRSPDNLTVTQDDTIILHCQATANPPSSISWTRENNVAIKAGFTQFGNGTLLIPKANKTDVGKYICTAKNVFNSKIHTPTATAFVQVKYEPTIVYKSKNLIVKEGGPVKLTCKADGYPAPTIRWSKSPGPIGTPNTGEWHNISSVKKSDDGTYTCTASNGIGNDATADIKVTVQYKPAIDEAASNTTGSSWNGHSVTLSCTIKESFPSPTWTWYKPNGTNFTYNNEARTSSIIVTTGHQHNDYGLYKCKAENDAGSDIHQISVTQLFPPGPPNVTVTDVEAVTVTVHWTKPTYNGGSSVTGYKLDIVDKVETKVILSFNVKEPNTAKHLVNNLTKDTQYEVKLYARNVVGYGKAANTTFRTKEQGPPAQPIITKVVFNQASVTLTWLKPEENGGTITGYTIYKKVKDQDSTWTQVVHISGTPLTYTVKNLERGKTYLLIVTATNKYGESVQDDSKAKIVKIPFATTNPPTTFTPLGPSKGQSSGGDDPNQTIIIVGVVVAVILILITAVISIVILRKKNIFGQSTRKSGRNESAAYHNDVDTNDSLGRQAAVNLNDDIPTYAAVDMSKKTKKKPNDIPTYAAVDKSKKKRPGEIIYAELADFNTNNTNNTAAAPRPDQYAGTDYADISQFQQQSEPEPTYANFQGRSKDYANVEDMSSQA